PRWLERSGVAARQLFEAVRCLQYGGLAGLVLTDQGCQPVVDLERARVGDALVLVDVRFDEAHGGETLPDPVAPTPAALTRPDLLRAISRPHEKTHVPLLGTRAIR